MKRSVISFAICMLSTLVSAQDVLVTKNGDAIKAYGTEMGSETVFYQESQATDAPTKRISKNELLIIKYADGRVVNMTESTTAVPASQNVSIAQTSASASVIAQNKELINKYNSNKARFIGEPSSKKTKVLYCECTVADDSKLCDDNLELIYKTRNVSLVNNKLAVTLKNKTQRTIYIDLGNSFFTSEEVAEAYYVPQVTSTSTSKSTGVSVNAGAVAGALGVGGALGTLANGVNVGGGTTHGTLTSTFSQRVVAIPPMSVIELAPKYFVNRQKIFDNGIEFEITNHYNCIKQHSTKNNYLTIGSEKNYTPENSILHFSNYITYSFSENIESPTSLNASFYVSRAIAVKSTAVLDNNGSYWGIDNNQLSDGYTQKLRVLVRQQEGK
ncbi:MAG: hypothetical protein E7102_00845 [Prevotella ruminicola]|uniref:Uncharacterized protein n=1 Tax=Xylanibacter ruminicola TaxID=839 RepID=A0A928GHL7_XYLRU|nr:hypothetical protein [Xylanibacter ruminicola]